jgi:hypothetical protein
MKDYGEYSNASMSMTIDDKDKDLIENVLKNERITHIIETGTYLGKGSTKMLAESLLKIGVDTAFITIEANWESWIQAKRNLKQYRFVLPLWGKTVSTRKALNFIANDEALLHHENYPDIYIDDLKDPVKFYSDEIKGKLGKVTLNPFYILLKWYDKIFYFSGEELLERYLIKFRNNNPLIVLDSAGGIGYLEFNVVKKIMGNEPYILLLDDIHHLKHFRSMNEIKSDSHFKVLHLDIRNGWILTKHF